MFKRNLANAAVLVAGIACASFPASAQIFDTDFSAMIMNQNLGAMNTYTTQMDRIQSERDAEERRNGSRSSTYDSDGVIPPAAMARLKNVVLDVLDPEYKRRLAAYGSVSAKNWAGTTLSSVGGEVGALRPEYQRRIRSSGQGAADSWLVSRTRAIAGRYISPEAGARRAAPGEVPAASAKKAEDAAFAVINPEINRRARVFGQAAATSWSRSAGQAVGADIGKLKPEYLRRMEEEGAASADDWFVAQSREIAERYVATQR